MKRLVICLFILVGFVACKKDKSADKVDRTEDLAADTLSDKDTIASRALFEVFPEPDGLFNDFIDRFMNESAFQSDRIDFPLCYVKDGRKTEMERSDWQHDSLYASLSEYTFLFDAPEVKKENEHPDLKTVRVELIDLKRKRLKQYKFERREEHWALYEIDEHDFSHDGKHEFFDFYSKFVNDEKYQLAHVHDPFNFKTYDSDNFEEIEGNVSAAQWMDFRTYMPADTITNTVYNDEEPKSNYRTFVVVSPSSEMNCILVFKWSKGRWELISLEN